MECRDSFDQLPIIILIQWGLRITQARNHRTDDHNYAFHVFLLTLSHVAQSSHDNEAAVMLTRKIL